MQFFRLWLAPSVLVLAVGCGGGDYSPDAATPVTESPIPKPQFPDPTAEVASEVEQTIQEWVEARVDEQGMYAIAPTGGVSVSGKLAGFHTVHQKDADTYTVCVDFQDGDSVYDVDFFVDRGEEGLQVRDGFLHKVDGEVISG